MRLLTFFAVLIGIYLLFSGCLANSVPVDLNTIDTYPTFLMGIWHGLICPVSFVFSLFSDGVAIYQSGGSGWYDLGFLIGISASFGGGGASAKRARRR